MTHDYKSALDALHWIVTNGQFTEQQTNRLTFSLQTVEQTLQLAQEAEQLRLKLSETVIHLAARNTEIEQLRKERDELAKAVVALDANLINDNEVIFKKRGMRQHSQVDHKSTIELAKKVSDQNGNA